jgi:hypothetical protein
VAWTSLSLIATSGVSEPGENSTTSEARQTRAKRSFSVPALRR